ncbi:MAG: polyhydroxyalkanoate depolymerase, partial [Betaproteobacteria bacterium]|nr:polyhydroxyalkanoate depolymerase [Betaproteobacteria bacterium]
MLYSLFEAQHAALSPLRIAAEMSRNWFGHPFSPLAYLPTSRRLAASSDLFLRVTQRYGKPAWGIHDTVVDGRKLPVEIELALDTPFCKLLHFRRELAAPRRDPKVLLVAPLSGHHATLLRDTVRTLLPEHEVWITDWVDARLVPLSAGAFHLDDYVDTVREFIRLLAPDLHVISVCQPTVPVLAAISLMAAAGDAPVPATMVMMGGPIDARKSPTAVNNLATKKPYSWFENHLIQRVPAKYPGFMRRVYPGFLQHLGFVAMNPDRHMNAHWDYYNQLLVGDGESAEEHRRFYDEYNAVLDMPAEYYLDTVKTVFQDFALPQGRMTVHGETVQPQAIRDTALLSIEGELDDISGSGQTEAAHTLCVNVPRARRAHYTA